jgi:uncharacterized membrane protein SirB2
MPNKLQRPIHRPSKSRRILIEVLAKSRFLSVLVVTGLVLLIPLIATCFTDQVRWGIMDFMVAGVLLIGVGSTFVLLARRAKPKYRCLIAVALAAVLICVWAELAVGLFIF